MGKRRWAMMSDDGWVIGKTIGGIVDQQKQARPGRFREAGRHHRMGGNSKKLLGSTTSCASLLSALLCMGQGGVRSMGWAGGSVWFCFFFFWAVWRVWQSGMPSSWAPLWLVLSSLVALDVTLPRYRWMDPQLVPEKVGTGSRQSTRSSGATEKALEPFRVRISEGT